MRLSYKLVGAAGNYIPIVDETDSTVTVTPPAGGLGGNVDPFDIEFDASVQEDQLAFSKVMFRRALGNVAGRVSFSCNVLYATADDALTAVATFQGLQNYNQSVHIQHDQGATTVWYPNAVLQKYKAKLGGPAVDHLFTFQTDPITLTAPAT